MWDKVLFVIIHVFGAIGIVVGLWVMLALFGSFVNAKAHGRRWP